MKSPKNNSKNVLKEGLFFENFAKIYFKLLKFTETDFKNSVISIEFETKRHLISEKMVVGVLHSQEILK